MTAIRVETIQILAFEPRYQQGIDLLMEEIGKEFSENFTSPGSRSISELASLPGERFWVALAGKELVGTIGLSRFNEGTAILKRMFVARDYRGKNYGVSEKLLEAVIGTLLGSGAAEIFLGTMSQFKRAQRFYLKHGFSEIGKDRLPAGMELNPVDTVFFRLEL